MIEGRDRGLDQRINIKSEFGFGFFSHIRFRCMHSLPRVCRTWEALRYSNTTDILSLLIQLLVVLKKKYSLIFKSPSLREEKPFQGA